MKKILVSIILVLAITGCANKPQRVVVTDKQLVYVSIPQEYLVDCKATRQPKQDSYLGTKENKSLELVVKDYQEKETKLSNYINSLHRDIGNCNSQLRSIRTFDKEQNSLINNKK